MNTLKGKTVVVVGATGGIGSVLSRIFWEQGANVVLAARTEGKLQSLRETIGSERLLAVPSDAAVVSDVENLLKKTAEAFGRVDAVVASAGSWKRLRAEDSPKFARERAWEHYESIFLPSFTVAFVAQAFLRKQGGEGLIVDISSHAAVKPELSGNLSYGPMKAATRHLMLSLRQELGGTGVRVTSLLPSIVNTPDNRSLLDTEAKREKAVQPEEIGMWIAQNLANPNIPAEMRFESEVVV